MRTHSGQDLRKPGRTLKNILFAALAALLFFAVVEAALRLAGFRYLPDDMPLVVLQKFNRDNYKDLYRFDPHTLWSLKPHALYERTTRERINSLGFRGPEIAGKKPQDTFRVVCLGDSSTFGFGVPYKDSYPARLNAYLSFRMQDRVVEVIDAGVVGYTSTQALAHFRRDALPLDPDAVVIMPGAINETFEMESTDAQRIAGLLRRDAREHALRDAVLQLRLSQFILSLLRKGEQRRPGNLVPRAPLPQFREDLEAFAALSEQHGFLLVVASPHRKEKIEKQTPALLDYTAALKLFSDKHKLPFVDVRAEFRRAKYKEDSLFQDDYHPRAQGHDLIAQMLTYPVFRHEAFKKYPALAPESDSAPQ